MNKNKWGRYGLIGLCLASMLSYTLAMEIGPVFLWLTAVMGGAIVGWFIGSGEWKSLGQDLVSALVSVVCVMFGSVLPIIAIGQQQQSALWVVSAVACAVALLGALKLCARPSIDGVANH